MLAGREDCLQKISAGRKGIRPAFCLPAPTTFTCDQYVAMDAYFNANTKYINFESDLRESRRFDGQDVVIPLSQIIVLKVICV